ncbi:hypothetical protein ACX1GW_22100, partial [Yersinia enterocolitica]
PGKDLPEKVTPGEAIVTEPNKRPAAPVETETPARDQEKTATPGKVTIEKTPEGDGVVTPETPDGEKYPEGTLVQVPGVEKPIEIGEDGSGKIPGKDLPEKVTPGEAIVTEPNKRPAAPVETE